MSRLVSVTLISAAVTIGGMFFATSHASAADLRASFKEVCASPAIKSDKLQAACAQDWAPEPIKDGSRFKAVGIGEELNALIANLAFFKGAAVAAR
jgi:hypothetical protein